MTLAQLFKRIIPYVKPYRFLLVATLSLTLLGSLLAQVNAVVLDRTVDAINALVGSPDFTWGDIFDTVPLQPEWTAAMTRCNGSNNRTGVQSAVRTPIAIPGISVMNAS